MLQLKALGHAQDKKEKKMKVLRVATLLSLSIVLLCLSACLTLNVNVNFPESAVQQATDNYVHELYRQKEKGKPAKTDEVDPNPVPSKAPKGKQGLMEFSLFNSAWAGASAPQFRIDSPKALKIKEKAGS